MAVTSCLLAPFGNIKHMSALPHCEQSFVGSGVKRQTFSAAANDDVVACCQWCNFLYTTHLMSPARLCLLWTVTNASLASTLLLLSVFITQAQQANWHTFINNSNIALGKVSVLLAVEHLKVSVLPRKYCLNNCFDNTNKTKQWVNY